MNDNSSPSTVPSNLRHLLTDLRGLVLLHRELGVDTYPDSPGLQRLLQGPTGRKAAPPSPRPGRAGNDPGGAPGGQQRKAGQAAPKSTPPWAAAEARERPSLTGLADQLKDCRQCPHHQWRQQVVFGQGPTEARLLLVGEFPGPTEERAGLPCQGEAGALLNRMLAAIQLTREEVYLTTLVKCLPAPAEQYEPETAQPGPAAIRACLPFLQQQIAAIGPALICTLGPLPAQALLNTNKNLLQLRGRFHRYRQIPLMPTLAPEFLLHNQEMKKAAWQDLQMIQKFLQKK